MDTRKQENTNSKMEGRKMLIRRTDEKEILKVIGHNTLRWIRETCGIDFEKQVTMLCCDGPFSIGQIWKRFPHYNYDYNVVVIVSRNSTKYPDAWYNRYHAVKLTGSGTNDFVIELNSKTYFNYRTCPDTYYRKSDFTDTRKSETVRTYIVAQKTSYKLPLRIREKYTSDKYQFLDNVRYTNIQPGHSQTNCGKSITVISARELYGNPEEHNVYVPFIPGKDEYTHLETFFDKSGYYTQRIRENRIKKAACIRADRQKAALLNTDLQWTIDSICTCFTDTRKALSNRIINTPTYDGMKTLDSIMSKLSWLSFDIELHTKRINNKEYKSIEQATKEHDRIIGKLENIRKMIDETEGT